MKNQLLLGAVIILLPLALLLPDKTEEEEIANIPKEKTEKNIVVEQKETAPTKKSINVRLKLTETNEIITLPLEEYIIGVVAAEMPASFEMEALKAQSVASRTYALQKINLNKSYDLVDTVANQAYINEEKMKTKWKDDFAFYRNKIKEAVLSTQNEIITYNGSPIHSYYFAYTNGLTENASVVFKQEEPYLQTVESKWDPTGETEKRISRSEFCKSLAISCDTIKISDLKYSPSHRVESLKVNGKTFLGTTFRKTLSLRSTDFTITLESDTVLITTKGYGHGVGMSQYGANGMAKEGNTYKDILTYYYKGTKIETI